MQSNLFRTTINIHKSPFRIIHQKSLLSIGSCFSENISRYLLLYKFNVCKNPYGITYHPIIIINQLKEILSQKKYNGSDLFYYHEKWNSFMHHGSFSNNDKTVTLSNINEQLKKAHNIISNQNIIILTLGTAYAYIDNSNRQVVNNCHKLPASNFQHVLIEHDEITESFKEVFSAIQNKIILTVSPIRHTNVTASQNSISKAHLLLACEKLQQLFPEQVYYFPAYEIMMDELRDYRFYDKDMIHPNETAIDYIWDCFKNNCIDTHDDLFQQIKSIHDALQHRPRNADSLQHRQFLDKQLQHILQLENRYQYLHFEEEKSMILKQLKD